MAVLQISRVKDIQILRSSALLFPLLSSPRKNGQRGPGSDVPPMYRKPEGMKDRLRALNPRKILHVFVWLFRNMSTSPVERLEHVQNLSNLTWKRNENFVPALLGPEGLVEPPGICLPLDRRHSSLMTEDRINHRCTLACSLKAVAIVVLHPLLDKRTTL
ncbi:hypothetical protein C8Q75DRAFT_731681 [Abortiporus biennis]|nr:hypothetical protein C8Q75DRAFT_731681 [Abortiporus biennis]